MKFGNNEVMEINVLDERGFLVTTLNTLKSDNISYQNGSYYVVCQDALLDLKLMEFISKHNWEVATDLEKLLHGKTTKKTFTFGKNYNVGCQLVLKGIIRNAKDGKDAEFTIYFPKVNIRSEFNLNTEWGNSSVFEKVFECISYNDEGDILQFII